MKGPHLLLGQVLDVDETIAGALDRGHELVQLQTDRLRVLVLGALNQKDHQEGHHRGPGVDDELPRVREPEQRTGEPPDGNGSQRYTERWRAARPPGDALSELFELAAKAPG